MRIVFLTLLPLLAGCVCDPPVEQLSPKTHWAKKKVARVAPHKAATFVSEPAAAAGPASAVGAARLSVKPTLRSIHVKNCDCPEDFDPKICGDRSAYTSWSPNCPSLAATPPASERHGPAVKDLAQP